MTPPDVDTAYDQAEPRTAFSNGFEGESWMAHWCERCVHDEDCPHLQAAS